MQQDGLRVSGALPASVAQLALGRKGREGRGPHMVVGSLAGLGLCKRSLGASTPRDSGAGPNQTRALGHGPTVFAS